MYKSNMNIVNSLKLILKRENNFSQTFRIAHHVQHEQPTVQRSWPFLIIPERSWTFLSISWPFHGSSNGQKRAWNVVENDYYAERPKKGLGGLEPECSNALKRIVENISCSRFRIKNSNSRIVFLKRCIKGFDFLMKTYIYITATKVTEICEKGYSLFIYICDIWQTPRSLIN